MNDQSKSIFKPDGKNAIHDGIEHEPSAGKALIDPTEVMSGPQGLLSRIQMIP